MSDPPDTTTIRGLVAGERVRVRGRIIGPIAETLEAPLSRRACVAYEERSRDGERGRGRLVDFVIDDDTGRARVVAEGGRVELGATTSATLGRIVDADLKRIELRLSDLRSTIREAPAPKQARLRPQITRAKALVTLLCAVRAHERGHVHTGGSLEGQAAFIERERVRFERAAEDVAVHYLERFDVTLEAGHEVVVEGVVGFEDDPDPGGRSAGYRSAPQRAVLRDVSVEAQGDASSRAMTTELYLDDIEGADDAKRSAGCGSWLFFAAIVLGIAFYYVACEAP